MVSATVDKKVCEYYFGKKNMEFYKCKKAKYEGTLNQDPRYPMSRDYIAKNNNIIKQIKQWSRFENTLSFKKFMQYYSGDLHCGNCAGCDHLKGKNIDVIGTPHIPEWIYKLFAYTIGCEFNTEAEIKPGVTVEHNGWRFRFMTYIDEVLRAIQFYIIESQLEQAVGRARLLRCNCTVNLFSNFPLRQAKMMNNFDYEKEGYHMQLKTTFELSMVLDSEKFHKVLTISDYLEENENGYIDQSLASKGITVVYRDSQYKKKVKLIVHPNLMLDDDEPDPDKLTRKLEKHVNEY